MGPPKFIAQLRLCSHLYTHTPGYFPWFFVTVSEPFLSIIFPGVHFSGGTHPNAKKLFFKSLGFLTQSNNENAGVDFLNLRYEITTANSKELSTFQGCAKTWVFHQKPSPVGLTGLNRVLMGFMG